MFGAHQYYQTGWLGMNAATLWRLTLTGAATSLCSFLVPSRAVYEADRYECITGHGAKPYLFVSRLSLILVRSLVCAFRFGMSTFSFNLKICCDNRLVLMNAPYYTPLGCTSNFFLIF
ncbi:uncharacterized protein EDB93DRAFT_1152930 [Suillus bovinus]|uniref:uncharacterized protein n=1 Tax=Suillus bovinus TaxID=48563 RepID=UPI001B87A20F|nr:uncharacterized protein EDB93DRAFT_1152930 [Suillus bovinus]KAG2144718.1 hypothetical protein EDB93DRAFT_1152930 [Suillus bovinus]